MDSLAAKLAALPEPERSAVLSQMAPERVTALRWDWRFWGRPEQLEPGTPGAASARLDWRTWIILCGRGWGKALALDTPIPTPTDWTTMGDLHVGDRVLDESGRPCSVTFTTDV